MIRAALTGLLLAAPLAATQNPADRLALDRFTDSLAAVSPADSSALRAILRSFDRASSASHDPLGTLRAGLAATRLGELGATPDFHDAVKRLRRAVGLAPAWPYAWHALGMAEFRRARWEQSNRLALGNRVGMKTLARAGDCYLRALSADPAFAPAALALSALTLSLHDTARYAVAAGALGRAAAVQGSAPTLMAWGRVARAAGQQEEALAAFQAALVAGHRSPVGLLEVARSMLAMGLSAGEQPYFEGAASDDSAAVAGYRDDLAAIASTLELGEYDSAHGEARPAFLARFWARRDREELRGDGDRLREHYRRLFFARRHFALTVSRRYYGALDPYRSGGDEMDDRGVIYVRHGEPSDRLRPFVFGLMPSESWRYARADGDLLFHFSSGWDENGGGDLYDYRLVESVLDLHGASSAPVDQLLLSRQSLSPLYGRMLNWGAFGAAHARGRERRIGQASIAIGTTTDSYELSFARRLTAYANLIAIGAEDGVPLAQFVFAIAPPETTPTTESAGASYPVRIRLAAIDAEGRTAARADTTMVFRLERPLQRGQYLIGRVGLPVPAGHYNWRAALAQGSDAGVVLPRDSVTVAPAGPTLSLSDLALGIRAASARWEATPSDTVLLTPFDLFLEGSEVELYYEAPGARAGAVYRHEIGVFRVRRSERAEERPVVSLHVDEVASAETIRAHRTLQLARLEPGTYLVDVTVTGPDGRAVSRRRAIRVVQNRK